MGMMQLCHSCSKGPIFYYLDEMSRKPDARELLERLHRAISDKASSGFPDLEITFDQYMFTPLKVGERINAISNYLKKYWFDLDSPDIFFPDLQPIQPIFAEGLLKAISLSLKREGKPTPIDAWWIVDHADFRMMNFVSLQQITLLMVTPRPAGNFPKRIWGEYAEAYTTARLGVVTRKFDNRSR